MILSGGVQMSGNGNRRRYDRAFKVEAVRLVAEERRKVTEVARELGINPNQLHRWKRMLASGLARYFASVILSGFSSN